MNKTALLNQIISTLESARDKASAAAAEAKETATDKENIAENKHDTLGLEAAYLAHGQSNRVMELEALGSTLPNQYPFVPDSGPVIEYLVPLDKLRTVRQDVGGGRLKDLGQAFFPHHVDQTDSLGPEAAEYVAQNLKIFVLVIEIPKRRGHVQSEVEGVCAGEVAHVSLHPLDLDLGCTRLCARFV